MIAQGDPVNPQAEQGLEGQVQSGAFQNAQASVLRSHTSEVTASVPAVSLDPQGQGRQRCC